MKIAVVGTGYVGLVSGTCFAESGNDVICIDIDRHKIELLKQGKIPIYEPGLSEMVLRNLAQGRLRFSTELERAVSEALLIFIAVGTPSQQDGSTNLGQLEVVVRGVAAAMDGYRIIVNKSTVPVGTAQLVARILARHTEHPFDVVSNPEFLKEGDAIDDFMKPDRVIVGTDNPEIAQIFERLYAPFTRTGAPILVMDISSAEMTKYVANAMLATRISFMNEMASLCEALGADINEVRKGIGLDRRIGKAFLFPGLGYGGSCFPKDILALLHMGKGTGQDLKLLEAVDRVNRRQPELFMGKVLEHFGPDLEGLRFGIWGLAFKPQTDDMREAPSLALIRELTRRGAVLRAYDPEAVERARRTVPEEIEYAADPYSALEGADALLLVTEWNQFRRPDFHRMKELMRSAVIFDGRNQYEPEEMQRLGFVYFSVGRPAVRLRDAIPREG